MVNGKEGTTTMTTSSKLLKPLALVAAQVTTIAVVVYLILNIPVNDITNVGHQGPRKEG